ncbi:hypothetical protein OUZ56_021277 [Daphnia magna]|uniref:Uncharacterized protein n=1 Tax=Daphnia magna TaxID=35525 RepID=A0ABQ9ZGX1_9CRUS|nr:hypothetical protein OUZ56_021277 [Daphnia magna]
MNCSRMFSVFSEEEGRRATVITTEMLVCMNSHFAPALQFLANPQGLLLDLDAYAFLLELKRQCKEDPNFLKNSGSSGNLFTLAQIDIAIEGRHAAVHGRQSKILTNWSPYLQSWRYITGKIGQNYHLEKIRQFSNRINRIATTGQTNTTYVTSRRGDDVATMLINEMTVATNCFFAPALVSFCRRIRLLPYSNRFSSIWDVDVQGYIKALKDTCCKDSEFLVNEGTGDNRFTQRQLVLSLLTRNAVVHGKRQQVLAKWKVFINSWIYVLRKIAKYEHPDQLKRIFDFMYGIDNSPAVLSVVAARPSRGDWSKPGRFVGGAYFEGNSIGVMSSGLLPSKNLVNKPQPVSERPVQPPLSGRAFKIIITNSPMSSLISVLK